MSLSAAVGHAIAWVKRRRATGGLVRAVARIAPRSRRILAIQLDRAEQERRWVDALVHARRLADLDAGDYGIRIRIARYLIRLGLNADALDVLSAARQIDPKRPEAHVRMGDVLRRKRRLDDARACHEEALRAEPDDPRLLFQVARTFELQDRVEEARTWLLRVRQRLAAGGRSPRDFDAWIDAERHLGAEGHPEKALTQAIGAFATDRWTRKWLLAHADHAVLNKSLIEVAERHARDDPDAFWFLPAHRCIRDGRLGEARDRLLAEDPLRHELPSWSVAMRSADPDFLVASAQPSPRARSPQATRELAVVATYFNPCGYRSRRLNFERFHENVSASGVRLLVIELVFDDRDPEVGGFEETLTLRGGDVLWQKERLLDVGIARLLAEGYGKIAWLDCDIRFLVPDWTERIARALDRDPICQVFDRAHVQVRPGTSGSFYPGIVARSAGAAGAPERRATSGLGWAGRSDLLEAVPLYDEAICGGGDRFLYLASHAGDDRGIVHDAYQRMLGDIPPQMAKRYAHWAETWSERIQGSIGWVEQPIQSLYHGSRRRRRYGGRLELLRRYDYSPERDLRLDPETSAWRWTDASGGLAREMARYFEDREEDDGLAEPARTAAAGGERSS